MNSTELSEILRDDGFTVYKRTDEFRQFECFRRTKMCDVTRCALNPDAPKQIECTVWQFPDHASVDVIVGGQLANGRGFRCISNINGPNFTLQELHAVEAMLVKAWEAVQ